MCIIKCITWSNTGAEQLGCCWQEHTSLEHMHCSFIELRISAFRSRVVSNICCLMNTAHQVLSGVVGTEQAQPLESRANNDGSSGLLVGALEVGQSPHALQPIIQVVLQPVGGAVPNPDSAILRPYAATQTSTLGRIPRSSLVFKVFTFIVR